MLKAKCKKLVAFSLSCLSMLLVLLVCRSINSFKNSSASATLNMQNGSQNSATSSENKTCGDKMIGFWVPYTDLDNSSINDGEKRSNEENEKIFKQKFQNIVSDAKNFGANTLIVHVRSHGDAMYRSKIFPWSHLLTGTQGIGPGFDPLSYMIDAAHENGLKFHAWVNPLRIQTKTCPKSLSDNNPYFKLGSEKYFINHTGGIYYNPAYSETRQLIVDGVKEIVQNYDVDGIHFDDYFYPEEKNLTSEDSAYKEYLKSTQEKPNLCEWRKKNINSLVSETYKAVKSAKSKVLFGISPSGNIKKCHEAGADVELWSSQEGYVDYLCPQIYWSTDYSVMPFEKTASEWKSIPKNNNIKLYAGLALYKVGTDRDDGTWKGKNNILASEFKIIKKLNYDGLILYSYGCLNSPSTKEETDNLKKEIAN